ncbi:MULTISPECIES: PaaI family thioesterase [unclassified Roseateles]|uniref:PaaI family thioesterase n=1 Tax=Pelomonas sp. Root1237 TaxID=1736434 RepID=UPI0006F8C352|nr:PaaI family thioesterase [Pelomonas sp. Root1237]KQV87670.1 aromatic compound catabolic protein [Pelomonas sp. Root1237]
MSSPSPEAVLSQWQADEAALRTRQQGETGLASRAMLAGKTGLQQMQAMLDGLAPRPPISETLDFLLISVEDGIAVFQGRPQFKHYNPLGSVHGGWFATLLDSALGCAVHTTLPVGRGYTTLEFKINLVRALSDKVPFVRAIGKVVHRGRQVTTSEATLVGHDGKLYAHASTTCLLFDLPS